MGIDDIVDVFTTELVRELLTEVDANVTDEEVVAISKICGNNPWDAPLVYKILKL